MSIPELPQSPISAMHFIDGSWQAGASARSLPVISPYTGGSLGTVPLAEAADVEQAVTAARRAFVEWSARTYKERSQPLFAYREALLKNLDTIANAAALEAGKTVEEARAGVLKGIEVVEFALSLQNLERGGSLEVSKGVTCEFRREPLGVVAGITPFNFPAMVPLWMYPIAITVGNCFILKPSEKTIKTPLLLTELMEESGFPSGVFSLLHGDKVTAEQLARHPLIAAIAFVGSSAAAQSIYTTATTSGKRALCLGGAKNHVLLLPDADEQLAVDGIVSSFCGCAGQRCMAASVLIAVNDCDAIVEKVIERAASLRLGEELGAIISHEAKERISAAIERATAAGAVLRLDGRSTAAPEGRENGNWLGASVLDHASPQMECATEELFGPVLTILRVGTLEEAMKIERESRYGNATSVFTSSGEAAQYVSERASAGMIGVNVGVPVPREPFSFGGTKASKFGAGDITGESAVEFWTNRKKVTAKWRRPDKSNWMS